MMVEYDFLYSFTKDILNLDDSIIQAGIMNKYGVLLNVEHKDHITLLLTDEENEEYASQSITRHKKRIDFEPKIGKVIYAFGRYKKVDRATVPISDDYYMLLMFQREQNLTNRSHQIIRDKVLPLVETERKKFDMELSPLE
ncbi:MAG: hypothetical protein WAK50_13400 [Nitrososphaeraceae archaeon]|jgi:hypothetical protein